MSLTGFWAALPFEPDPFQVRSAEAVEAGRTVVVTAPTGAGKTVVGEAAVHLALERGRKAFYTTPLKALSNQKYRDFCNTYPPERVGLLTGDNVINGGAPLVVMTTEVLRNMIYASSEDLEDLDVVILDEVHYLQDPSRGAVWEEVIIHAPPQVQLVALSATVSNVDVFAEWLEARRGPTELVVETRRPVPLESLYLIFDRHSPDGLRLLPLFGRDECTPNPEVVRLLARRRGQRRRFATPRRSEIARLLDDRGMLPALYFIFSRAGCEAAAGQLIQAGFSFTSAEERQEIRRTAEERTELLSESELGALGYDEWVERLSRGVAPHHAGMVSAFRETVETLFQRGLVKLVFATETLSLGLNMPAKTAVLETMTKFTGQAREPLLPGDYTQLTGRAGRRGIDLRGFALSLYSPFVSFERVVGTAAAGSHPITSSFRPTYNMAVNLIANYPQARAEELLNSSFGQFMRTQQIDRLERSVRQLREKLEDARKRGTCELGDAQEYAVAVRRSPRNKARAAFNRRLRPGSVLDVPSGREAGRKVVLQRWGGSDTRILVVGGDSRLARLRLRDLPGGTEHVGHMDLPSPHRPRSPGYRLQLSESLAGFQANERVRLADEAKLTSHPVDACPDRANHVAAWDRVRTLQQDLESSERQLSEARGGLVAELRAIRSLLEAWGYIEGWSLTARGELLRFLYSDLDLAVAEAIQRDLIAGLDPREVAAFFSAFVYEPRREGLSGVWPTKTLSAAGRRLEALTTELIAAEKALGLTPSRPPEPGMASLVHRWASGADLEEMLKDDELAAGDFVRTCRQLIDLLRQIRDAAPAKSLMATRAISLIDRNVVAASGMP